METRARYALIGLFALGVIVAVFSFLYWLQGTGGIGQRTTYQIRFESPVSGLLVGSNVLFNGMRVGEVTSLQLMPEQPKLVLARIAVDPSTPVRSDTTVSIDFQGLTGAPVIVLTGGSSAAPALGAPSGQPPLLVAPANAGQTLTQSARDTLVRFDKILSDNAAPLHDAIGNISTFAQVLGRNSERIDTILAGLERMTGGTGGHARLPIYDLTAVSTTPCAQAIDEQLVVPDPSSLMALSTDKIPVRGTPVDQGAFDDARMADTIPAIVQAKVIESLENSKCFRAVTHAIDGLQADLQLVLDIRSFAIVSEPDPDLKADIDVSAKLVSNDGKVLGSQLIHETAALEAPDATNAAAALDDAFGKMVKVLVPWIIGVATERAEAEPSPQSPVPDASGFRGSSDMRRDADRE